MQKSRCVVLPYTTWLSLEKTRDKDVRIALRARLSAIFRHDPGTLIIEELAVMNGESRIDFAVVNGELHGYEIKSEMDTLDRLPAQTRFYNMVFDRVTLVSSDEHLETSKGIVPAWWGLSVAHGSPGGNVSIEPVRHSDRNPSVNSESLATLLWREEILGLLDLYRAPAGYRTKNRFHLYKTLAETIPSESLRPAVRELIRSRQNWRVDALRT
jgi:hypothetical protein